MSKPCRVLIERYLPEYQFEEHHSLPTATQAAALLDAAQAVASQTDPLINRLIGLREMPARLMSRLGRPSQLPSRPFGVEDFILLGRNADHEIAYGLAGRFWQSDYGLQATTSAQAFEQLTGVPKLVLNFSIESLGESGQRLCTTTRVFCPDTASLRSFKPYWVLIRPVSGFIRQRLLKRIAQHALKHPAAANA